MIAIFALRAFNPNVSVCERTFIVIGMCLLVAVFAYMQQQGYGVEKVSSMISTQISVRYHKQPSKLKKIHATTWNIAAINNNPFEYWITYHEPQYNRIMSNVSTFIENPGDFDVPVSKVFTEKMYTELEESMKEAGWTGLEETRKRWETEYKDRKVITEFIKDSLLGKKRLASMPDRVTNTIVTTDGATMRPSVINCYGGGDLGTMDKWWTQWRDFMFDKEIVVTRQGGEEKSIKVKEMLMKIRKSKYPAITSEEEAISVPLQTLCLAIFDAILVNMMNTVGRKAWQPLREDMCNKLNLRKTDRTIEILETTYGNSDIQFLQEVAGSFADVSKKKPLSGMFDIYYPAEMDADRDQNSFILLKKDIFREVKEVTNDVLKEMDTSKDVPLAKGDLLALTAVDAEDGTKYLLASFHGDTNGLATVPIVTAMHQYAVTKLPDHKLLFGMDANTYAQPEEDQQGVVEFAQFYRSKSLNSCYGPYPNPKNFTTFHARTHLQPQLNKAVRLEEKDIKGDKNPKDFIVFFSSDYDIVTTTKDNTGDRKYIENMVFPTLDFPSDHGVTSTILTVKPGVHVRSSEEVASSETINTSSSSSSVDKGPSVDAEEDTPLSSEDSKKSTGTTERDNESKDGMLAKDLTSEPTANGQEQRSKPLLEDQESSSSSSSSPTNKPSPKPSLRTSAKPTRSHDTPSHDMTSNNNALNNNSNNNGRNIGSQSVNQQVAKKGGGSTHTGSDKNSDSQTSIPPQTNANSIRLGNFIGNSFGNNNRIVNNGSVSGNPSDRSFRNVLDGLLVRKSNRRHEKNANLRRYR